MAVTYLDSLESRSAPPVVFFSASAAAGSSAGGLPFRLFPLLLFVFVFVSFSTSGVWWTSGLSSDCPLSTSLLAFFEAFCFFAGAFFSALGASRLVELLADLVVTMLVRHFELTGRCGEVRYQ